MTTSLTSIFDSNKETLAEKLKGFSLPKDSQLLENTVAKFLNDMFENDVPIVLASLSRKTIYSNQPFSFCVPGKALPLKLPLWLLNSTKFLKT